VQEVSDASASFAGGIMIDSKHVRTTLVKKLEVLEARGTKIGKEIRQASEPDAEERAIALENAEVLQKLDHQVASEIQLLRGAIQRIDSGTFGTCEKCGKAIADERLAALPYATTCTKCAT
jgi:DnaK suppressor protein